MYFLFVSLGVSSCFFTYGARKSLTASFTVFRGFPETRSSISANRRPARCISRVLSESLIRLLLTVPMAQSGHRQVRGSVSVFFFFFWGGGHFLECRL